MRAQKGFSQVQKRKPMLIKSALALAVSQVLFSHANAANIVVNSNGDVDGEDGVCTLREAVTSANNDNAMSSGCVAGSGDDVITFASGYSYITLTQAAAIPIYSNLAIQGIEGRGDSIDASSNGGHFSILAGTVSISDLTLYNGLNPDGSGGGAINQSNGNVTIDGVVLRNNVSTHATGGGGAIRVGNGSLTIRDSAIRYNSTNYKGGGIHSDGTSAVITVESSQISRNYADDRGGGIEVLGTVTISNSTITGNSSPISAAIRSTSNAVVNITNSTIAGNSSSSYGAALTARFNSQITLANSIVSGNISDSGDLIVNGDATITANKNNIFGDSDVTTAQLTNTGDFNPGPYDINAASDAVNIGIEQILLPHTNYGISDPLNPLLLPLGSPARDGGDPTVCTAAPVLNQDQRGLARNQDLGCDIGAVEMTRAALLVNSFDDTSGTADCTLRDALMSVNDLSSFGGCAMGGDESEINFDPAIFSASANNVIDLESDLPLLDNIFDLTIYGRGNPGVTLDAGGFNAYQEILSVFNSGITLSKMRFRNGSNGGVKIEGSSASIVNSTISDNYGADYGGGLYLARGTSANVSNSTISGNTANSTGGGIDVFSGSTLFLRNSTVSGNAIDVDYNAAYGGGGGISLEGNATNYVQILNSTITGNSAQTEGGGVYLRGDYEHFLSMINSILAGNRSVIDMQGHEIAANYGAATAELFTNLVGTSAYDAASAVSTFDLIDMSNKLFTYDMGNLPLGSIIDTLSNNGGPTMTHALVSNSPAIEMGNSVTCLATDQTGKSRGSGACDLGSIQFIEETSCFVIPIPNQKLVAFCL